MKRPTKTSQKTQKTPESQNRLIVMTSFVLLFFFIMILYGTFESTGERKMIEECELYYGVEISSINDYGEDRYGQPRINCCEEMTRYNQHTQRWEQWEECKALGAGA